MEDVIHKLGVLHEKIKFMKNSKEKALFIKDYYNMVAFLYHAGKIDSINSFDLDWNIDSLFEKYYEKDVNYFVQELWNNAERLIPIFQEIIRYYQSNGFKLVNQYEKIQVNYRNMNSVLPSFFWNISDEALAIYQKMLREKRIVLNLNCPLEGFAINTMHTDFAYAIIRNTTNDLEHYVSLAHEIGHIYAMYKERFSPLFINFDITSEVVSLLFEKLFFYYLELNEMFPLENLESQCLHHYNIFHFAIISKTILELYQKRGIKKIDRDLLTVYPKNSKEEIGKKISLEMGCDFKTWHYFNLTILTYPIGEIVSNHFFYQIIHNHDLGMHELDNFLANATRMSLQEIMMTYMCDFEKSYLYIDSFMEKRKAFQKSIE